MIPAFVINLDRREDRFTHFVDSNKAFRNVFQFERISAVDGMNLNLDLQLRARINPWNFEHLDERTLRGVVGCALSHMRVWEKVGALQCELAAVFEDDAVPISSQNDPALAAIRSLVEKGVGDNCDLIWLNDYERFLGSRTRIRFKKLETRVFDKLIQNSRLVKWKPTTEVTTESYLLCPKLARAMLAAYKDNIGAIDEVMRDFVSRSASNAFRVRPPLFTQRDRKDSDIR